MEKGALMKHQKNADTVTLLGIPFLPLTKKEARARLVGLALRGRAARVFTPNPEMLLRASEDEAFASLLRSADLLLPDGVGVLVGARLCGKPLPERITGIDSAEFLLSFAAKHSLRVFLLGGREGVAEAAESTLTVRFPSLTVCGTHHGYFDKEKASSENQAVLSLVRRARPDLLFVCFGAPTQERWIAENANEIPSLRLCMGLGGALDVWSGSVRRAPKIIQRCGLEWLWRAFSDPKRFPRLLAIPRFLWKIITN